MTSVTNFIEKNENWLQIALLVIAAIVLCVQITSPFVDYDEATYAKVVVDTIKSGDVSSFTLSGHHWFEKPPLYLWLAIVSVKIFGAEEFAFRLPGIFASLLCLWLVYLIVKELTRSSVSATFAFLLLLSSPFFYYFGREMRLDSGVLMGMLAALFFCIKGWYQERYLFWVLPAIAMGFLFKSFVVVLIIPIILIYSFCYGQWNWLQSRYFWIGLPISLILLIPWHLAESLRFGWFFWDDYLVHQVYQRSVSTLTGLNNYYDYVNYLWTFSRFWLIGSLSILVFFLILLLSRRLRSQIPWKHLAAPLCATFFILVFFTLIRTHLAPYMLPALPFFAMFVALLSGHAFLIFKPYAYLIPVSIIALVSLGIVDIQSPGFVKIIPYNYEEAHIGQTYKTSQISASAPLYSFDWSVFETMNYYGDTKIQFIDPNVQTAKDLRVPFYMVTTVRDARILFYDSKEILLNKYSFLTVLYKGDSLVLLYSDRALDSVR